MMRTTAILTLTLLGLAAVSTPPAVAAQDNRGFLYGTVETRGGNEYRGFLRWGREESFWDDHFNSVKEELPHLKDRPEGRGRRSRIRMFGITIGYRWDENCCRQLISRFGDIREIRPLRGDRVDLTMKNGSVLEIDGGSNDIGARVTVHDESLGEVKVEWKQIERIVFAPAPADLQPPAQRLYGKLTSRAGTFEGYIQWDLQECLSTDELDGESDDGDLSIEMGKIKAIEKRNRNGSWVELKDGRRILLEDTNDVDSSNDGIFVEDERFGRVEIDWDDFERLDFEDTDSSGRGYDDYPPARSLTGTVIDTSGARYTGRIVFDLDESETWEMLDGDRDDVEYHIPFDMIASIEPLSRDSSRVVLRNGIELELEDSQDVAERNDGVVIVPNEGRETYVAWRKVERIVFD